METSRDILVVDDHVATADFLVEALHDQGYVGKVAYDGKSALRMIERARPGLVLLDLHLPGLSGVGVLAQLRRHDLADMPIVLITADAAAVADLHATIGSEYLLKPFGLDTLLACIGRYICPQ